MTHRLRTLARGLLRSPGFTIVATLTIALGIASATVVFSMLDAAFLHDLPYREADRLVVLSTNRKADELSDSYPDFLDWRARNHSFADMAAFVAAGVSLTSGSGDAERIRGQIVTPNLFRLLGVRVARGRDFADAEADWGTSRVAILSDALWKRRFDRDPSLIGRTITLDRQPYEVVGIMPPGFDFPGGIVYDAAELWMPSGTANRTDWMNRGSRPGIVVIGRLRDGVTLPTARRDLDGIAAQLRHEYPADDQDISVLLRGALQSMVGDLVPALVLVGGASGLLLLITSANLAGLLLARLVTRRHEIAIRRALGATRRQIITHVLSESALLGLGGAVAGVILASLGIAAVRPLVVDLPRAADTHIDWRAAVFALVLSSATSVLFGVGPALAVSGSLHVAAIRRAPARRVLVGAEIAAALVMVVAATTLARSFVNMMRAKGGIDPSGVLTMELRLPEAVYADTGRITAFYRELCDRLGALPGMTTVGGISTLPFSGGGSQQNMRALDQAGDAVRTDVAAVTPGYFAAIGAHLVSGRDIQASDDSASTPVAVVDDRFAMRFWPSEPDVIGKRITGWGFPALTIVGVIRHVDNYGVTAPSRQELFVPHAQRALSRLFVVMRTTRDPATLAPSARRVVRAMDSQLPVYSLRPMRDVVAQTITAPRLAASLSVVLASLALGLAAIGLYGLLAYTVNQRTREIGVRMALGATARGIIAMVIREIGSLIAISIAAGLLVAAAAVQLLKSQVFGVAPFDTVTFAAVSAAFVLVAILASALPALRAARVSPSQALAHQ